MACAQATTPKQYTIKFLLVACLVFFFCFSICVYVFCSCFLFCFCCVCQRVILPFVLTLKISKYSIKCSQFGNSTLHHSSIEKNNPKSTDASLFFLCVQCAPHTVYRIARFFCAFYCPTILLPIFEPTEMIMPVNCSNRSCCYITVDHKTNAL